MDIMYDPYGASNNLVPDSQVEQFYLDNNHRSDWVWTGQHEVIHRAQLGLLRGEIDELRLRVFDYDKDEAFIFVANEYGDFTVANWYDYIHDHSMEWTVERSKLSRQKRLAEIEKEKLHGNP